MEMGISETIYRSSGEPHEDNLDKELDNDVDRHHEQQITQLKPNEEYKVKIVWKNVILFAYLHLATLYGVYLALTSAKLLTNIWGCLLYVAAILGISAGVHRLWSHNSYKAKWPLRLTLMIFNTIAHQNHIYEWVRDHRVHHKSTETDADPYNAKRGFFFSHVGWLLCRKHPDVIEMGKKIDMSDLEQDSIVMFQKKYYSILMPLFCFIIPTVVPVYLWGETWRNSWYVATVLRYVLSLNATWLVNSAAHMWGNKPYDRYIYASENKAVSIAMLGEGWHNYHHVFPWDYRSSEFGDYFSNPSTAFIDFCGKIGWASDFRTVSPEMIRKRAERTGDGSHPAQMNGKAD